MRVSRRVLLGMAAAVAARGRSRAGETVPPLYITMPKPLPALAITDGAGHPLTLDAFRGKFVLLNIWATWCVPCRKEMPSLDRLQAKLGGPRFQVVPLSIDTRGLKAVKPFYAALQISHLGMFLDPSGSAMQALDLEGVPTSLLIDPEGHQIGRETGPVVWDSPAVVRFLAGQIAGHPGN